MKRILRIVGIVLLVLLALMAIVPLILPIPPLEGTLPVERLVYPDSRFTEVNGLTIHYQQAGEGKPAIILLHGFGSSTFSWREVIQPLGQFGSVVAYDRPAFGLTERPLQGSWEGENPYSPDAQIDLLFGLMDQMGWEQAVLIGNSAGGTVAVRAALEQPERVLALVLVDAAIYNSGGAPAWTRPLLRTPQAQRLGPLLVRSIETRGMDLLDLAWHDTSRITPEVFEGYRKPLQVENWDVALWQMTLASGTFTEADRLGELSMPVLVVTGDDDRIVPTADSLRLAEDIPGAQLAVFENCGHVPQEECPEAFLEAVVPFIQELY